MQYYYLMAQLPFLVYDQKPPMSSEAFKELAKNLLNEKDAALLKKLVNSRNPFSVGESKTGSDFIDNWLEWERVLRLNLAKHRALHLRRDNANTVEPPCVPQDAAVAAGKAATTEMSPLEGELLLDKARWDALETLAGIECFSRNQVYSYYVKLLLLERRAAFNVEKGFAEYKNLYKEIIQDR